MAEPGTIDASGELWWSLRHHPLALIACIALALIVLASFAAPLIAPQNPYDLAVLDLDNAELPPLWLDEGRWPYLLGTDKQGRDLLSAILYGSRISLIIGLASVLLSLAVGLALGLVAGYFGGLLDNVLMRIGDVLLSLPTILIAILVSAVFRQLLPIGLRDAFSAAILVLAISLTAWSKAARLLLPWMV